jgi:hypothetical protein
MPAEIDSLESLMNNRDFPIGQFEAGSPPAVHGGHNRVTNNGVSHTPNIPTTMTHRDYEMQCDLPGPLVERPPNELYDPIFDIDYDTRTIAIYGKLFTVEAVDYKTMIKNYDQKIDAEINVTRNRTDTFEDHQLTVIDVLTAEIKTENRTGTTLVRAVANVTNQSLNYTQATGGYSLTAGSTQYNISGSETKNVGSFIQNGSARFNNGVTIYNGLAVNGNASISGTLQVSSWFSAANYGRYAIDGIYTDMGGISTNLNVTLNNSVNSLTAQINSIHDRLTALEQP